MTAEDASGLEILDREECLALLAGNEPRVGRVGFTVDGEQFVLPVNYAVVDATVVFRSGAGSKLGIAADGGRMVFEADTVDGRWHSGWSVLVRGTASIVTDVAEQERLLSLDLQPWAQGDKSFIVRLEPLEITGRRLG